MQFPFGRLQELENNLAFLRDAAYVSMAEYLTGKSRILSQCQNYAPSLPLWVPWKWRLFHVSLLGLSQWASNSYDELISWDDLEHLNFLHFLPLCCHFIGFIDWPSIGQIQGCQKCYYAAKSDFFTVISAFWVPSSKQELTVPHTSITETPQHSLWGGKACKKCIF